MEQCGISGAHLAKKSVGSRSHATSTSLSTRSYPKSVKRRASATFWRLRRCRFSWLERKSSARSVPPQPHTLLERQLIFASIVLILARNGDPAPWQSLDTAFSLFASSSLPPADMHASLLRLWGRHCARVGRLVGPVVPRNIWNPGMPSAASAMPVCLSKAPTGQSQARLKTFPVKLTGHRIQLQVELSQRTCMCLRIPCF